MQGVVVYKAKTVHEDDRRKLIELCNGQMAIKNLKILVLKNGGHLLGNHWHTYPELMYMLKGSAHYRMQNLDTGETADFELEEGDLVFRTGRIVHGGWFEEGSIIIDGAESAYIGANINDIQKVII
jgi:hypothetical protein